MLRPDTPKEGKVRELRPGESADQLSEPLRTYAEEAKLVMRRPPIVSYTMPALQATEYAQEQGKFMEFHWAANRAFWEDGKDLGDLEVLGEIAESVSLDSKDMIKHLEDKHYTATVMGQYQEALQHGIQAIPTFLVGNLLFSGAQPYDIFKTAMDRVLAKG